MNSICLLASAVAALLLGFGAPTFAAEPSGAQPAPRVAAAEILGLTITDLAVGHGDPVQAGMSVQVHYTGWLSDPQAPEGKGQKFDSSHDRQQPFSFQLGAGQVIRGWDDGVAGMRVGGKRRLLISPQLGYGTRGAGNVIPPDATLLFEVELLAVGPAG